MAKPLDSTPRTRDSTAGATDWSERYLGLAGLSTTSTAFTLALDESLVIHVAFATAIAFAALALLHSRHVRMRTPF